jgi:hypothetical protein
MVGRLLLVALVAGGAALWTSGRFPQPREISWHLGNERASIRELEIQIWNPRGELLKREVLYFPDGAPAEILEKAWLADGDYLARIFIRRSPNGPSEQRALDFQVAQKALALSITPR